MKRLLALSVVLILSAAQIAAANSARTDGSVKPKQKMEMKDAKKVMRSKLERDKKVFEIRKQAQVRKHQAQNVK